MTPHCSVEGHVGSSGGRVFRGTSSDEVFVWTDDIGERGSAGKARTPAKQDESVITTTASRNGEVPKTVPIASDKLFKTFSKSTWECMIGCNSRRF